jgi:uncharacterized protein YjeT (DUF2065 family)
MIFVPLWVALLILIVGGLIRLVYGPRWKREAEERRQLFELRRQDRSNDVER